MLRGTAASTQHRPSTPHCQRCGCPSLFLLRRLFSVARIWACIKRVNFRTACEYLQRIQHDERKSSRILIGFVILLIVMCTVLSCMNVWLIIYGPWQEELQCAANNKEKLLDNNAILDLWRLHEAASTTNDEYHKKAFLEYLFRYKQIAESQHGGNARKQNAHDGGSLGKTVLMATPPSLMAVPKENVSFLLNDLAATLKYISKTHSDGWEERAVAFVLQELSETDSAVADGTEEVEALEPFDDILYLQLREFFGEKTTASVSDSTLRWWRWQQMTAPSVHTRRYYYPLRRYHRSMHRFSPETWDVTTAWFDAIAEDYYGDAVKGFELPVLPKTYTRSVVSAVAMGGAPSSPLDSPVHTGTIFVNIGSFRDKRCWPMVQNMMQRATNMFRMYIGAAEQHNDLEFPCVTYDALLPQPCVVATSKTEKVGTDTAFDGGICFPADNVRVRHISPSLAKGPTYGRYMAMLLFRGEEYTFVIDSHNHFLYAWDYRIVAMHMEMDHPKVVLSHYAKAYTENMADVEAGETTTAYLCRADFVKSLGYIRLLGVITKSNTYTRNERYLTPYILPELRLKPNLKRPLPQPWAAGGFLFAKSTIVRDVPFDPHLAYLFDGEEVLFSVRLWTHGYDIHSPKSSICFHFYKRLTEPKFWQETKEWKSEVKKSHRRTQHLLRVRIKGVDVLLIPRSTHEAAVTVDADRYGMGRRRSVEDWYRFAGVDPVNYVVERKWC